MSTGARFLYGLAAFVLVAALIDKYDEGHGTGYLWAYTFVIGAGLAIAHAPALAANLGALTAQANSNPAAPAIHPGGGGP